MTDSIGYIYRLVFPNGKCYVGETMKSIEERVSQHQSSTKRGCSYLVHRAMRKYGLDNVKVERVFTLQCTQEYLDLIEDKMIDHFNTLAPSGYNLRRGGVHGKLCEEVRRKLSIARKGHVFSAETRAKISAAHEGKILSMGTRAKISLANKGKAKPLRSEEHRANLSAALKGKPGYMLGKHHTEEAKAKISAFQKVRLHTPCSEETRKKMSLSQMGKHKKGCPGRPLSEKAKARLSALWRGRVLSEETRAKISAAKMGHPGYFKGRTHSEESKMKISTAKKGKPGRPQSPEIVAKMLATKQRNKMLRLQQKNEELSWIKNN